MTVDILVSAAAFRQVLFKYLTLENSIIFNIRDFYPKDRNPLYWISYISKSVLHNMQQNLCLIVLDKYEVQLDVYTVIFNLIVVQGTRTFPFACILLNKWRMTWETARIVIIKLIQ